MTNSKGLIMKLWTQFILLLVALISIPSYAATVRYQHTDMLGSVVSESDASGNIISRSHYEPFGKRIGGDKEGIGYTGHLQDKDLGLTYMQARYYDPLIGRFYSNDPIGFRDVHSFNRYAYGNNNPYKYTDPDGKAAESWLNRPAGVTIQQNQDAYTGAAAIAAVVWTAGAASSSPLLAVTLETAEVATIAASDGPVGLPTNLGLKAGAIQTVDPKTLSTNRTGLDAGRLKTQQSLVADGVKRDSMITVDTAGKVIDGNHGVKASSQFVGEKVDVKVIDMPDPAPGERFVKDLEVH